MYKMLVSDLDETLLNDDGTINQKNVDAIKKATAMGFKFVPNTGRSFKSVAALLTKLGLKDVANQYVISYNGGAIVENEDDRLVITRGVDFELAKTIFHAGLINDTVDAHVYTVDTLYIYNISPSDKQYMEERQVPYQIIDEANIDFLQDANIMKVIFESTDEQVRQDIRTAVLAEVEGQVEATFSSGRYIEFNKKGTDKGSASLMLGEKLGIAQTEIIAAGDNNNDLSMIKAVGLGVAVQNAIPTVKEAADVVTERTNNEGAVAEIFEKYVFPDWVEA
ncbi:Cof-type HAD-IIB family hydrolase [Periweissella cryptocerci]|nr:Cof-type HAD-IIB family hydrolase [Periweissella cryptocerci]